MIPSPNRISEPLMKHSFKATLLSAAISAVLVACNADDPDVSSSSDSTTLSGVAIDGYIAYGTVYIDANDDDRLSVTDPRALTDREGYFSYNPNSDTNYCADDASILEQQFCLHSFVPVNQATLRITGGYDIQTGEAFTGSISTIITQTTGSNGTVANININPFTSLMGQLSETEKAAVLAALDITENNLGTDYLGDTTYSDKLYYKALQLHKTVTLINQLFTDHYDDIDELPSDFSHFIYEQFAKQIAEGNGLTVTEALIDSIDQAIRARAGGSDSLPSAIISSASPAQMVITRANQAQVMIKQLVEGKTKDEAVAAARAVEVFVQKVLEEESDASINNALPDTISGGGIAPSELNNYLSKLEEDSVDLQVLINSDDPSDDIDDATPVISESTMLNQLNTKQVLFAYNKGSETGEIVFFFDGESNANQGDISGCVKYNDTDDSENNTVGTFVTGHWAAMPGNDYAILMGIELGSETFRQQLIMKSIGLDSDTNEHLFRFEFAGEYDEWTSEYGVIDTVGSSVIPTSSEVCKNYFGS